MGLLRNSQEFLECPQSLTIINNNYNYKCVFYAPERLFMHHTVCCRFIISYGWGGGVSGGEERGPSWSGSIRRVEGENKKGGGGE